MTRPIRAFVWLALALLLASSVRAAEPIAPASTIWLGGAQLKGKIPGAGSGGGPADLELLFGPNGGAGLAADEFHLIADDGTVAFDVVGTYGVDAKGQPVLMPDTVALADELKVLMQHICEELVGLSAGCSQIATLDVLYPSPLQIKVKTKAPNGAVPTLQLSAKLPFVLTDGMDAVKVSLSIKSSPPAELQP